MKRGHEREEGIIGATRGGPAATSAKRWAGRKASPFVASLVALGLLVLLYRAWPELGFGLLCATSAAAGWLLSRRTVELICLAEAAAVTALAWSGSLPGGAAAFEVVVAFALAALAHLAAEGASGKRVNVENERRLQGVTFLLETAEFLASTTDRGVILNTAVHASAREISTAGRAGSAHAAFHEVAGDQATVTLVVDEPRHRVLATGFEYPLARNQAALAAIRTGRPAIVRPDHLNGTLRTLAEDLGWQALIMAPVYSSGSICGLLAAASRDGPAVDQLQLFMLGRLARFTSASLDSAAAKRRSLPTAITTASDGQVEAGASDGGSTGAPIAARPTHDPAFEIAHLEPASEEEAEAAAGASHELGELITHLTTPATLDGSTGLLNREHGLAALEQDMRRSRRMQARTQSLAVLRMPASRDSRAGGDLIRLVVDHLRSHLRRDDLIFRYADDEIVCWFGEIEAADVQRILNRVQNDIAREIGYVPFAIGLTSVEPAQSAS